MCAIGNPCVDLVYLLTTSLEDGLLTQCETELLRFYSLELDQSLLQCHDIKGPELCELQSQFDLCLADFVRFALADAPLIEADIPLCLRAHSTLSAVDQGDLLQPEEYAQLL